MKTPPDSSRQRLVWSWPNGRATALEDYRDPTAASGDLAACLYDGTGALVSRIDVPGGALCGSRPCWMPRRRGFAYRDPDGTVAGLRYLRLTAGADRRASISLHARGAAAPLPALPLALPVVVQLRAANGTCWEAHFDEGSVSRNDPKAFRGRAVSP